MGVIFLFLKMKLEVPRRGCPRGLQGVLSDKKIRFLAKKIKDPPNFCPLQTHVSSRQLGEINFLYTLLTLLILPTLSNVQ